MIGNPKKHNRSVLLSWHTPTMQEEEEEEEVTPDADSHYGRCITLKWKNGIHDAWKIESPIKFAHRWIVVHRETATAEGFHGSIEARACYKAIRQEYKDMLNIEVVLNKYCGKTVSVVVKATDITAYVNGVLSPAAGGEYFVKGEDSRAVFHKSQVDRINDSDPLAILIYVTDRKESKV